MNRLIANGLMFGALVPVTSPALVERYNRALKHLTGKTTALADFHIDISGFSPEIGDELGNDAYLSPGGANRQFILLTTAQKEAPLLHAQFSTVRGILTQFIEGNEAALFALTARDAVAGELQNSVFEIAKPADLFQIGQVMVEADTIGRHVRDAGKLTGLVERFRSEPDGWRDDALIGQMIELAKRTGDVTRMPVSLPAMTFRQPNFWTSKFGGLYVFRDARFPGVVSVGPATDVGPVPVQPVMDLSMRNALADWLERNQLVEPIVQARGMDAGAVLRQKMDFILVDAADTLNLDAGDNSREALRRVAHRLGSALPAEFLGLAALLRWVEKAGDWPRISSQHPAYFYTLRARAGADRDLVNMLLAELSPLDVRQLFITHKEAFYAAYAGWSERKKTYVADFLAREYAVDRQGARTALFGAEPGMEPAASPWQARDPAAQKPMPQAGPWGSVQRGRR